MAKIIDGGLTPRQSRRFGINHAYITKTLTSRNYRWYAIIRDCCYLYIHKVHLLLDDKRIPFYDVHGWDWRDGREFSLRFDNLHWALDDINSMKDGFEGIYPPEFEVPWIITPVIRNPIQLGKQSNYQFISTKGDKDEK